LKRALLFVLLATAIAGCKLLSKSDANANADAAAAAPSTVASAGPAASASASAAANDTPPVPVAAGDKASAAIADPNAKPTHEADDQAAQAEITKANYKREMDKLEKEDLTLDTK
jgi:hypothetical protein